MLPVEIKRSRFFLLFFLSIQFSLCGNVHAFQRQRVVCKYVMDGDTIMLTDGRKVRYLEINAPEIPHKGKGGEPLGLEAKVMNETLVKGRVIEILPSTTTPYDRFGRLLAHCFLLNGKLVSEILVRKGYAHVCFFEKPDKFARRLLSAQKSAILHKRGIWGINFTTREPYYIGNKRSLRFHRPWCHQGNRTSRKNRVIFHKREDAFMRGYCRCKKCLP